MSAFELAFAAGAEDQVGLKLVQRPLEAGGILMWIDKAQTWQMAGELGGPALVELIIAETHTCYLGERGGTHAWGRGCGSCPACELRRRGYEEWSKR